MPTVIALQSDMTMLQLKEDRFRTARLSVILTVPLRESTAAEYAVLPGLLTRCTREYPTVTAWNRRLNSLYGADIQQDVQRLGDRQMIRISVSFLQQRYTLQGEDLASECCRLLPQMLFEPVLEDGVFRPEDMEQERRCLLERLRAEMNDKRQYSRRRCEELLCPDEPYSVHPCGTEETVAALTPASTAAALTRLLSEAQITWIYQGGGDVTALCRHIEQRFAALPYRRVTPPVADATFVVKEDERTETMAVNQAKLVLGFRIAASEPDGPVMAARLMTVLWGGTPVSLLFRHVREEQSLCYYCLATYDRFHGVILVESGIEAAHAERTREEVLRQLDAIRQGNFSEDELESARRALKQRLVSADGTPREREVWYAAQTVYGSYMTPEEAGNRLQEVTREDVCRVARLTHLDSTYLLQPAGKEAAV